MTNVRNIKDPNIYAVIPVYNEEVLIESFLRSLADKLLQITPNYKIVVINDGSSDGSVEIIQSLVGQINIKFISFSRNFGQEAAITAGLEASENADAAIIMDCDFQHPIEVIDQFYEKWCEGFSNVYGVRNRTDQSATRSFLSETFFKVSNELMGVKIPANAGYFRLLDKQCIKAFNSLPENGRFIRGLFAWIGFKEYPVPFDVADRQDGTASRWGYRKLFKLAFTGIFSFSSVPLRLISIFGVLVSIVALAYGFYIFMGSLFFGGDVSGWPTIVVSIMFFSGVQLISLGVLGEYISRIFEEAKKRPRYIIDEDESRNL
ncbi:glycosyltransferase family 2 protein [Francisella philomiragia]|uniref:glycosyltransferase family 2 protein n=1 Tax=Francisella philomiragia TaxID=28110 RepID=UPI0005A56920|nr:glycosyltransferase family 2 protein [Francisella philomiragia]AJI54530.1 glycosyl transferase 2 family protein [Francisella philomiragia]MBK2094005.1 glycosyltransferase family 2 protein [Francisella philomiragia]MBK2252771.1 glycosyltransferase family 2 protein [Francisella philomiragia]MBK2256475.1 glycosyltransferase family 2 protein [Francisella philomiragia]MBK2269133.1 glycosyltransferase family 2 protein [Francisella philomiragia]